MRANGEWSVLNVNISVWKGLTYSVVVRELVRGGVGKVSIH